MSKIFLKAAWRNLIMANYQIDPSLLLPYLPAGTQLDTWQDRHYVSLVGFLFDDTRVLGMKIPWHVRFEEVNLRFYVKRGDKRGVVFIKEIVPRPAISWVANTLYKEHYVSRRMNYLWEEEADLLRVRYGWKQDRRWNHLEVWARNKGESLTPGSEAEFITEHYWGYTRKSTVKTGEYRVAHPAWEIHPVVKYDIQIDTAAVYGPQFSSTLERDPLSVFLAKGSMVEVFQDRPASLQ